MEERMNNDLEIKLRPTMLSDLELFFQFQRDEEATFMAAFTAKDPADKAAYLEKWTRLLDDPTITMRTILANDTIAGSVAKFVMRGEAEITYWIDKPFWGRGIASTAVKDFLKIEKTRPIFGRTAFDNYGSQRVLEKCGFVRAGTEISFANARGQAIKEIIYNLRT